MDKDQLERAEELERAEMLADVRSRLFTQYPYLAGKHQAKLGKLVTTRWDLFDTLDLDELPSRVREVIKKGSGKVIEDDNGNPLITIYPDQRPASVTDQAQIAAQAPVQFKREGIFAKITPVIAELRLLNGLVRYQRVGLKRCKNTSDKVALGQLRRERAMASHLLDILDQKKNLPPIAKPLVIGKDEILYEWWTNNEGHTHNLVDAHLTPGEYLRCIADAAEGLTVFHRNKIKYLGLSESNIAVGKANRAKVVDLGAARLYDDVVDADTAFEERYYDWRLVQQQELHRSALDIADKYALGVLLRTWLQRYKLASIIQDRPAKRQLVVYPEFERLLPVLQISDKLRASLFHPNPYEDSKRQISDPEYCDLAKISETLRSLAKLVDTVVDSRGGLFEIVPRNLQLSRR